MWYNQMFCSLSFHYIWNFFMFCLHPGAIEKQKLVYLEQRCCSSDLPFHLHWRSQSKHFSSVSRSWSRCGIWKSLLLSGNGLWGAIFLGHNFFITVTLQMPLKHLGAASAFTWPHDSRLCFGLKKLCVNRIYWETPWKKEVKWCFGYFFIGR